MNPLSKGHVLSALGGAMLLLAGCSSGEAGASGETGAAMGAASGFAIIRLHDVPSDVSCVRVVVGGNGTRADVSPGNSASFMLDGLPLGMDAFSAFAYSQPCVSMDPSVSPVTWMSDEVDAYVSPSAMAEITLTLHPAPPTAQAGVAGTGQ
jgi:hypothetical protein